MANTITVKISRPTEPTKTVEVAEGSTIGDILNEADVSLGSGESVYWNGQKVEMEDEPQNGDFIQIVGKKDNGVIRKGESSKFFVVVGEDGNEYDEVRIANSASQAQKEVEELSEEYEKDDIKVYKATKAKITVLVE